jgi:hypothetical protein
MIDWGLLFSRLFGTLISWMQATNLRNQMYALKEENEITNTNLDIIAYDKQNHANNSSINY